jgi:hypothetical protein
MPDLVMNAEGKSAQKIKTQCRHDTTLLPKPECFGLI